MQTAAKQLKQRKAGRNVPESIAIETNLLRTVMVAKGVSAADIAKGTGMSLRAVQNIIGGIRRLKARQQVEDFLQEAIWSSPDEFNARQGK
jgi:hypothetical protein